jgi:hypothetical protein
MTLQTADRLWALLYGTWGSPRRASRMTSRRDHDRKYSDIDAYSFTVEHLAAHLAGTATYAATLGAAGAAWAGCKDYDSADEAEILAALDQAQQKGIAAAAIVMPGRAGEHTGGHLWVFYDRPYAESDIRAQLRTIRRLGKGEDYPSGNPIRLPFGYHQIKKTRGILILQDRRRFNLDTQLAAGINALLSLPRNGKPQPAPAGDARISGAAWGDTYKPEQWENLPDGGALWHSAYIAAAAGQRRPDLAKLLCGERVTIIKKDDTRDDSDSAQVAALAYNLLSADVCKPQARAIADHLYTQIRPSKTREHYRAHFDVELERYTPKHYRPKEIRFLGPATSATPQPLPPAEYRPEPKSRARKDRPQQVAGAAGYLAWLRTQVDAQSGSVMLSQAQCAARLGCCVRTIKRYEYQLRGKIERRVFAQRQAGCLFILVSDVVTTSVDDVVIADLEIAQQSAENAQPATMQVEHTAPPVPRPSSPAAPRAGDFADVDMAEIDRMVADIQIAANIARLAEHHEPQPYWERHEAVVWHEANPVVPEAPAAATKRQHQAERNKVRLREKWEAMMPSELARQLAILRNYVKSHPAACWPRWQIIELNERLAALTPAAEPEQQGDRGRVCSPQPTPAVVQPDLFADAPAQNPYYAAALGMAERLKNRTSAELPSGQPR